MQPYAHRYQLPAVEKYRFEDQVFHSLMWSTFLFHELNESCRVDPSEKELAGLLSRLRLGKDKLTTEDIRLLKTRMCSYHGKNLCTFEDIQRGRPTKGPDGKTTITEDPQTLCHCKPAVDAIIAAALCEKVDEICAARMEEFEESSDVTVYVSEATDIHEDSTLITDKSYIDEISRRLSNMKRTLRLYVGMEAILTVHRNYFIVLMTHALPTPPSHHCKTAALCCQVNKCQSDLFVNGQLGVITAIELEDDNQTPKILYFRPAEAAPNTEPLRITREKSY